MGLTWLVSQSSKQLGGEGFSRTHAALGSISSTAIETITNDLFVCLRSLLHLINLFI